jgi:hypothetical protein
MTARNFNFTFVPRRLVDYVVETQDNSKSRCVGSDFYVTSDTVWYKYSVVFQQNGLVWVRLG